MTITLKACSRTLRNGNTCGCINTVSDVRFKPSTLHSGFQFASGEVKCNCKITIKWFSLRPVESKVN